MNNTIYIETKKGQRKVKTFPFGQFETAMRYGWKLTNKNQNKTYFILTENDKCLRFNRTVII